MKYYTFLTLLFLLSTFWLFVPTPIIPLGLLSAYLLSKKNNIKVPALLLMAGTVIGYFNNGLYLKLEDGKILFGINISTQIERQNLNYYSADDIEWGSPAHETDYINSSFKILSSHGPNNSGDFPISIKIEPDLTATFDLWVSFNNNSLSFTNTCTHYNSSSKSTEQAEVSVTGNGEKIENGYLVTKEAEKETRMSRKACGFVISPGKYLLFRRVRSKGSSRLFYNMTPCVFKNYLCITRLDPFV